MKRAQPFSSIGLRVFLILASIGFLIYSNVLSSPFVMDSASRIEENPDVRITEFSWTQLAPAIFGEHISKNRPVANFTFALNYYLHGDFRPGYYLFNIAIHLVNAFLLFLFVQKTMSLPSIGFDRQKAAAMAFFSALVWLVHPVHIQSVTYIVQRQNSLGALFYLSAFLFYVYGRLDTHTVRGWGKLSTALICWLLALGCKQNTIVLPYMVILYEWYFLQDLRAEWGKKAAPWVAVATAGCLLVGMLYLGPDPLSRFADLADFKNGQFTVWERGLTQFRVVVHYISLFFLPLPSRLNLDYDFPLSHSWTDPVTTLVSAFALGCLIAGAVVCARRDRVVSFSIFWFLGNLAVESSIIPLAVIFEHRTYLPFMGLSLLVIWVPVRYLPAKKALWAVGLSAVCFLSVWTYQRNALWAEEVALWSDTAEKSPKKARPRYNLAKAYAKDGNADAAIDSYRKTMDIDPDYPGARNNLAILLAEKDRTGEAEALFLKAIKQKSDTAALVNGNYAALLFRMGDETAAEPYFRESLRIDPDDAYVHCNYGLMLAKMGRNKDALFHLAQAIRLQPDMAQAYELTAAILENTGHLKGAESFRLQVQNLESAGMKPVP